MATKVDGRGAISDLNLLARRSPRAMERALYTFGNQEMTEAKKRTPVEHGTLRDSGTVEQPAWLGHTLTVELWFGGAASEYAIFVHEDLEAFHQFGEAKFLERTLAESGIYFEQRVGAAFEKYMAAA